MAFGPLLMAVGLWRGNFDARREKRLMTATRHCSPDEL
jgi:hypothetical protein